MVAFDAEKTLLYCSVRCQFIVYGHLFLIWVGKVNKPCPSITHLNNGTHNSLQNDHQVEPTRVNKNRTF